MSCSLKMTVTRSNLPCPIYNMKQCSIEGYPPSCEIIDASPRNPCPQWICSEHVRYAKESIKDAIVSTVAQIQPRMEKFMKVYVL